MSKRTSKKLGATRKKSSGISQAGDRAEDHFEKLTRYERTKKRAQGDFIHQGVAIEVKKVTADKKTGNGTINQVRSLKNSVLVAYVANEGEWFVLNPREVIQLVASLKTRGQHNENPFECCNLSIWNLENAGCNRFTDRTVKRAVARAVNQTKRDRANASFYEKMLKQSQNLAKRQRAVVRKRFKIKTKN
jgi:hypothetical protein